MLPTRSLPWLLAAAVVSLTVQAEPTATASRPDPSDPQARVPALTYTSSLKPDQRGAETKPISWREANDTVARIGGWRVYAREAQQPEPSALPAPSPALAAPRAAPVPTPPSPPAMQHGHGGHKKP